MSDAGGSEIRRIAVTSLARVEGEGGITLKIKDRRVAQVRFHIFEPPRFFEALLQGRSLWDVPDITARICGICPVAYIMSACNAVEAALGVHVQGVLADLRRLIYCGEWIQSHVLHAVMLHAPDFLGLPDALALARREPALVRSALVLKQLGNRIMEVIGGRAVHPVNCRIGGFYSLPPRREVQALIGPLEEGVDTAAQLARAFAGFSFPDHERDYLFMSLKDDGRYPLERGRIVTSSGLDIPVEAFFDHFREEQVGYSTALRGETVGGGAYLVGPLARYANAWADLTPAAKALAAEIGLEAVCRNPFQSILVRMVEVAYACEEAARLARGYEPPEAAAVTVIPGGGAGVGATEAPRGICVHRYHIGDDGRILRATIVPPTSQNQRQIEADLRAVAEASLDLGDDDLTWRCEQTVRNYDPCISCATHFLTIERSQQP